MSYSVSDAVYGLVEEVGMWADKTFPESTPESMIEHIKREVKELEEADGKKELGEEMADIVLILMHLAHRKKIHLYGEIMGKFKVCKERTWGKPDAQGVRRHV